jgi:predicted nuclease of predicted toxin-antitoxin system
MPHRKRPYFRQKPVLYFDENFPQTVLGTLKENRQIKNCFKIFSVYDFHHQNKDDDFQYAFAKKKGFVLVTLDKDYMNDRKFPIHKIPGIILIIAGRNQTSRIMRCLITLTNFLSVVPLPKSFMGDSKFQVSLEGCVMRGRDAKTREIKTITITPGDTLAKIANEFHYFG